MNKLPTRWLLPISTCPCPPILSRKTYPVLPNGCAIQFQEEQEHALKFFEYIHDRGNKVTLQPIPQVEVEFSSPLEVFKKTLAHEQHVTSLINKIYKVAVAEDDVASQIFLQWFINEQVEEEKNASTILDLLGKIGGHDGLVYHIDHQVGKRGAD